jgi:ParB/RepB/Spo0J family partition protein
MSTSQLEIKTLPVADIAEAENNPNAMPQERFDLLVEAIREVGFLQPVLVRKAAAGYVLIDGHHRVRAALKLGLTEVPCVVAAGSLDDDDLAAATQIAMGRLRGDLDLAVVGRTMNDLVGKGWTIDDLALTGFSVDEVGHLLDAAKLDTESMLAGADATLPAPEKPLRPFVLEITFARREDYVAARKGLKHAAGKGGELADGLLHLLGEKA